MERGGPSLPFIWARMGHRPHSRLRRWQASVGQRLRPRAFLRPVVTQIDRLARSIGALEDTGEGPGAPLKATDGGK
jgi:hypothetical protein